MWTPQRHARNALALLLAAGAAFLGSAALVKAGRIFPALAGGPLDGGRPAPLVAALVVLLAVAGGLLAALGALEALAQRRASHRRR